jgi:hypothetical protein
VALGRARPCGAATEPIAPERSAAAASKCLSRKSQVVDLLETYLKLEAAKEGDQGLADRSILTVGRGRSPSRSPTVVPANVPSVRQPP